MSQREQFRDGDMVRVLRGKRAGTVGMVVRAHPLWHMVRVNFFKDGDRTSQTLNSDNLELIYRQEDKQ